MSDVLGRLRRNLMILILCLSVSQVVGAQDVGAERDELKAIEQIADQLNQWRIDAGLYPLVYNPTLEAMAVDQATYLLSLPRIPYDNIHAGRDGEIPRERSQYAAYQWDYYGFPANVAVTEIAAVGSVRSALAFWKGSDLHTRSVTNPVYREVGIAVETLGSDLLMIVVLGARPNVLTAYADVQQGSLYLTSDLTTRTGDWIGAVERYRLFDATGRALTPWQAWQAVVPLPPDVSGDLTVLYEDASGRQALAHARLRPIWTSRVLPETIELVVDDAQGATVDVVVSSTNGDSTSAPQTSVDLVVEPTPTPTPTASDRSVTLYYDEQSLSLIQTSATTLDLSEMRFVNGDISLRATAWENQFSPVQVQSVPASACLRLYSWELGGTPPPPADCKIATSITTISPTRLFWLSGEFEVLLGDTLLATCAASAGRCDVILP
jgi:uncharacterized protein YkwD